MTEPTKPAAAAMRAYGVALVFSDGPIYLNGIVAPTEQAAVAMFMDQVYRDGIPPQGLSGVATVPLSAEWLRATLRLLEGGTAGGEIVHLAVSNQPPQEKPLPLGMIPREQHPLTGGEGVALEEHLRSLETQEPVPAEDASRQHNPDGAA